MSNEFTQPIIDDMKEHGARFLSYTDIEIEPNEQGLHVITFIPIYNDRKLITEENIQSVCDKYFDDQQPKLTYNISDGVIFIFSHYRA